MADDLIRVDGLREFQAALKQAEPEGLQKQLRIVLNEAAELIVTRSRDLVPRRTGRAAASIKAQSSQREARVKAGGAKVSYYPWLDFGGSVGRAGSVHRPFLKKGRYLYPTYDANRGAIQQRMSAGLDRLARESGLA